MAMSPTEIAAWGAVVATITGFATKGVDAWLARRNKQLEEEVKDRGLTIEQQKIIGDRQRSDDEADAKLIAALMEERKAYQEEIRALRGEVMAERRRCDEEMEKLRTHCNEQIAELKGQVRDLVAELDRLRNEKSRSR